MVDHVLRAALETHNVITIIYQQGEKFTERNIKVTSVKDDRIEAYCFLRRQHRVFKKQNVLSAVLKENN